MRIFKFLAKIIFISAVLAAIIFFVIPRFSDEAKTPADPAIVEPTPIGEVLDPPDSPELVEETEVEELVIEPPPEIIQNEIAEIQNDEAGEPIDPVIAPSRVELKLNLENGKLDSKKIKINFVGVARDPVAVAPDEDGAIEVVLESGRYLLELKSEIYSIEGDLPAFFLLANREVDLGEFILNKIEK